METVASTQDMNAFAPQSPAHTLPTALMGFRKNDVLSYIDQLLAANAKRQQELETSIAALQTTLDAEQEDKHTLLGKTKELCEKLENQEKVNADLQQSLAAAQEEASGFRARLFTAEQEKSILRGEQTALNEKVQQLANELEQARKTAQELEQTRETVLEKEQEIAALNEDKQQLAQQITALDEKVDGYRSEQQAGEDILRTANEAAEARLQAARRDADKIVADANRAAVDLRTDAEKAVEEQKTELEQSVGEVAASIGTLKSELASVEQRMNDAYQSLRLAAEKIEQAIDLAQQKMDAQPARAPVFTTLHATEPVTPQKQPVQPLKNTVRIEQAKTVHTMPEATKTLSDLVLEKLTRLLG